VTVSPSLSQARLLDRFTLSFLTRSLATTAVDRPIYILFTTAPKQLHAFVVLDNQPVSSRQWPDRHISHSLVIRQSFFIFRPTTRNTRDLRSRRKKATTINAKVPQPNVPYNAPERRCFDNQLKVRVTPAQTAIECLSLFLFFALCRLAFNKGKSGYCAPLSLCLFTLENNRRTVLDNSILVLELIELFVSTSSALQKLYIILGASTTLSAGFFLHHH
jgi:hypothetical protein